jgi:hypothetical protein
MYQSSIIPTLMKLNLYFIKFLKYFQEEFISFILNTKIHDSSVSIALDYGLADRGSRVQFLAGDRNFSHCHCIQNGLGAHPASCTMGTRGSFPGGKVAGA